MKLVAILVLCAWTGIEARPGGDSVAQQFWFGANDFEAGYDPEMMETGLPNMDQIHQGFEEIGVSLSGILSLPLGLVNNIPFVKALKEIFAEQFTVAGQALEEGVAKLVVSTSEIAASNGIFDQAVQQSILATFDLAEGTPLADAASIQVGGVQAAANEFINQLNLIIKAQQSGAKRMHLLANLESQLLDLLATNKFMNNKGVAALKSIFNLDNIVNAVTHPFQTMETLGQSLANLQAQIPAAIKGVSNFVSNLNSAVTSTLENAGKVTDAIVSNVVKGSLQFLATSEMVDSAGVDKLIAAFVTNKVQLTANDVASLTVAKDPNAAQEFKSTIAALADMKSRGTKKMAVLAGVEAAIVDLMASNSILKLSALSPLLSYLGLSEVGNLLRVASAVIAKGKDRIIIGVDAVDSFTRGIKVFVQQAANNGGQLTMTGLTYSLSSILEVATTNKLKVLFGAEVAQQLKATFASSEGKSLTVDDVDSLPIDSKDEVTKGAFLSTLKELVAMVGPQASTQAKITALAGLNVALVDILSANSIIEIKAALALREMFAS